MTELKNVALISLYAEFSPFFFFFFFSGCATGPAGDLCSLIMGFTSDLSSENTES